MKTDTKEAAIQEIQESLTKAVKEHIDDLLAKAYERGYQDGYDQGCMDMLDDDLGEEDEEEWK